jgi:hypothetical protein
MSFDPHCRDLAELFLEDEPLIDLSSDPRVYDLAQHIQDAIESWFQSQDSLGLPEGLKLTEG